MTTPINRKEGDVQMKIPGKLASQEAAERLMDNKKPLTSPETPSSESGRGEIKTPDDFDRRYKELEQEADDKVGEGVVSHLDILEIVLREFQVDATQSFKSSLLTFLHEKAEEQRKCAEMWAKEPEGLLPCPFCDSTNVDAIKVCLKGTSDFNIEIICYNCSASSRRCTTAVEASKWWNKRAINTQQQIHSRASNSFQEVISWVETH